MLLNFEERLSDSPCIERVWRTYSERSGTFTSIAMSHWQMCIWTLEGETHVTVRGPETKATPAFVPPEADYFGIIFRMGTYLPVLPPSTLLDDALNLPQASGGRFLLNGETWEIPTYDNADIFVDRLVRRGLLARESAVDAALQGYVKELSSRSIQRRFVHTTGLPHRAIYQIERARQAILLLKQGVSILDTVEQAGYFDQPHLTRAMRRFLGHTPAQFIAQSESHQLSYHW